jgi:hypothetical protein
MAGRSGIPLDRLGRHADAGEHALHGVVVPAGGDEVGDLAGERDVGGVVVGAEGRLHEHHALDRQPGRGGPQGEQGPGGGAVDVRAAAGLVDHRREVLDLALDGVRRGVPARAAAAPVVGEHGEPPGEQSPQPPDAVDVPVAQRRIDQHQGGPAPGALDRDSGAVA